MLCATGVALEISLQLLHIVVLLLLSLINGMKTRGVLLVVNTTSRIHGQVIAELLKHLEDVTMNLSVLESGMKLSVLLSQRVVCRVYKTPLAIGVQITAQLRGVFLM